MVKRVAKPFGYLKSETANHVKRALEALDMFPPVTPVEDKPKQIAKPRVRKPEPKSSIKTELKIETRNEDTTSLVVLRSFELSGSADTRKVQEGFRSLSEIPLPFYSFKPIPTARNELVAEFPYAAEVIDKMLMSSTRRASGGQDGISFRPTVLCGPPGLGKSRLARRICERLAVPYKVISAAGMLDDQIFGVSRGFSSGLPSVMLEMVRDYKICNPVLIVDEIDKVLTDSRNGNALHKLLPLLEKSEASRWHDNFLGVTVDLSEVSWIFTANDVSRLPSYFRSRVVCLEMPAPAVQHVRVLLNAMRHEFAAEDGVDVRWYRGLDATELRAIQGSYAEHRSVRILREQYRRLLDLRPLCIQ